MRQGWDWVPMTNNALIPTATAEGVLVMSVGRRRHAMVDHVMEELGGTTFLKTWARANPGEFITKVWVKGLTKEVDSNANSDTVEDLIDRMDRMEGGGAVLVGSARVVEAAAPPAAPPAFHVHPNDCDCEGRIPPGVVAWQCEQCGSEWVDD